MRSSMAVLTPIALIGILECILSFEGEGEIIQI